MNLRAGNELFQKISQSATRKVRASQSGESSCFFFFVFLLFAPSPPPSIFPLFPLHQTKVWTKGMCLNLFSSFWKKKICFFLFFYCGDLGMQKVKTLNWTKRKSQKKGGEWNSSVINWDLKGEGKMGELVWEVTRGGEDKEGQWMGEERNDLWCAWNFEISFWKKKKETKRKT